MPVNENQMHVTFRNLVGNPTEQQVTVRQVQQHLQNGVTFVAEQIGLPLRTDTTTFDLEADVYEYPLPSDVLLVTEAFWDDQKLQFSHLAEWRTNGIQWRNAESGNPKEIAVEGREVFLYPPPDATAISTDGKLTLRCQMAGYAITADGVRGFSDTDTLLACYVAAQEFMAFHNADGRYDRSLPRVEGLIKIRLEAAQKRYAQMLADQNSGISVFTGRTGPAR